MLYVANETRGNLRAVDGAVCDDPVSINKLWDCLEVFRFNYAEPSEMSVLSHVRTDYGSPCLQSSVCQFTMITI